MSRVSVIIPTYNRADLIGETIQSVFDQTYPDWELIVVDDGSTDETAQVVAQFGERVTYIYQNNAGVCAARNAGFEASQGEFISFLDSDDRMMPHNLETLVTLLDAQPEMSIAYGRYYWTDENGQPFGNLEGPMYEGQILSQLTLEETMLLGVTLIRRSCVEVVGGFDETIQFQEHWDFYLRLAQAGCTYACTKQAVAFLRLHSKNRGRDNEAMLASRLAILNRLFGDPALEMTLSEEIRCQAYYNAYIEFAFYRVGHFEQGVQCLKGALQHIPPHSNDLTKISKKVVTFALAPETEDPVKFTRDLFEFVPSTAQTSHLRGKMLGSVNAALAFRHYEAGELNRVWRYALGAVSHDPSLWRNRGLVRIALEGLAGPGIVDWIRPRQHSHSTKLLEAAAQTTSIFISPHFDDAVLSCGGTLAHLAQCETDIRLVTVFTADPTEDTKISPHAQQLHQMWGEATHPHKMRGLEERRVAEYLNAKYVWLDFLDAIYRYTELNKSEELFLTGFDPRSDTCFEAVRDALLQVIEEHPGAIVFAPIGLGHHRDHLIVHQALEDIKTMTPTVNQYYYYEDYPYAVEANLKARLMELDWQAKAFTVDIAETIAERVHLIKMYASQLTILFDDDENIYSNVENYATRVGTRNNPRERFWIAREEDVRNTAKSVQSRRLI